MAMSNLRVVRRHGYDIINQKKNEVMKYDVFISYSRKDALIAEKLADTLQGIGFKVWYDQKGILSGDTFKRVIVNAISDSMIVLFLSSINSNRYSSWTAKEVGIAIEEHKKIIPIRLDNTPYNIDLRLDLVNLDYVNFFDLSVRETEETRLIHTMKLLKEGSKDSNADDSTVQDHSENLFKTAQDLKCSNSKLYLKYLQEAAVEGSTSAQINYGLHLINSKSVRKENEGFGWLILATRSQNAVALYNVGLCYDKGIGTPMDKKEALHYFRKAAMMGHANSQYKLGKYYVRQAKDGNSRYESISLARHWFDLASRQGCEQAIKELEILAKH